ncbi:hypothetical protein CK477_22275 [Enterobacter cloacae]|nr:hypothetical protein CK477_22275 [Enterobacter cloacae]
MYYVEKSAKRQRCSNSFRSKIYPLYWDLASAGLFGLVGMIVSCQALAATTGSLSGANIQANDGDTIVADSGTSPGMLHGILNPAGQPGTIDLGSHVTISADDPAATMRGISIKGSQNDADASSTHIGRGLRLSS